MSKVIIWSLATRALHLAFAGGLSVALLVGFLVDDDSPLFQFHMLAGLLAGGALVVRLALGFLGGRHTRFADWTFGPVAVLRYLRSLLPGAEPQEYAGHNPAASWVMAALFATAGALVWTGLNGGEDLHEGLAWALVALIATHLAGLAAHTVLKQENVALAMLHGKKRAAAEAGLASHGWIGGLTVIALLGVWSTLLWTGYDSAGARLTLPGLLAPISLGENEGHSSATDARGDAHEQREHHD